MSQNILVAGIGNIFLGDDAFGVEVTQRLYRQKLPEGTKVVDFGIRGFDLAYALMDDHDVVLLVDAMPRGEIPGTIFVIEPDFEELDDTDTEQAALETHGMNPMKVLHMVRQMGNAGFKRLLVVGCEPSPLNSLELEEGCMGLSAPVEKAVDEATKLIQSMLYEIADGNFDSYKYECIRA